MVNNSIVLKIQNFSFFTHLETSGKLANINEKDVPYRKRMIYSDMVYTNT